MRATGVVRLSKYSGVTMTTVEFGGILSGGTAPVLAAVGPISEIIVAHTDPTQAEAPIISILADDLASSNSRWALGLSLQWPRRKCSHHIHATADFI